jgi:hypothetical protein
LDSETFPRDFPLKRSINDFPACDVGHEAPDLLFSLLANCDAATPFQCTRPVWINQSAKQGLTFRPNGDYRTPMPENGPGGLQNAIRTYVPPSLSSKDHNQISKILVKAVDKSKVVRQEAVISDVSCPHRLQHVDHGI